MPESQTDRQSELQTSGGMEGWRGKGGEKREENTHNENRYLKQQEIKTKRETEPERDIQNQEARSLAECHKIQEQTRKERWTDWDTTEK